MAGFHHCKELSSVSGIAIDALVETCGYVDNSLPIMRLQHGHIRSYTSSTFLFVGTYTEYRYRERLFSRAKRVAPSENGVHM